VTQIKAVVFDAGETLFDETRAWEGWADWLAVPRLTFMGVLGAMIAQGRGHEDVFTTLCPGLDIEAERAARIDRGHDLAFRREDLYSDAAETLQKLKSDGFIVGVAGNQPSGVTDCLAGMGVDLDLVTTSSDLGVEKPDPRFFSRIAKQLHLGPHFIAYVGDRVDNDVIPAKKAGMVAVFIRRGPWGVIHSELSELSSADVRIESLSELPRQLDHLQV
jgi:FMN phosphatase YigB (HAD superfamily)